MARDGGAAQWEDRRGVSGQSRIVDFQRDELSFLSLFAADAARRRLERSDLSINALKQRVHNIL